MSGTVAYSHFCMRATLPAGTRYGGGDERRDRGHDPQRPPPDRTEGTGPAQTDVYDVFDPDRQRARGGTVVVVHGGFWRGSTTAPTSGGSPRRWPATASTSRTSSTPAPGCRAAAGRAPSTSRACPPRGARADTDLPDTLVLVGHSAGGHLVTWLASEDRVPGLRRVVALGPRRRPRGRRRAAPRRRRGPRLRRRGPGRGAGRVGRGRPGAPAPHRPGGGGLRRARRHRADRRRRGYVAPAPRASPATTAVARGADHIDLIDPDDRAYLLGPRRGRGAHPRPERRATARPSYAERVAPLRSPASSTASACTS